jgi:hypothetical protein
MHRKGVLAKNNDQPFLVLALERFEDGENFRAGETLEIAELFQDHRRVCFAANVQRLGAGPAIGECQARR